jgi:23S rRNA (uracil1939-C5)-methyltransferase
MTETAPVVVVRAIAAGGDGVASLGDGRTVFIPRAAPGDELRLRNVRIRARFARAEIADLITPGPDRVEPPCLHYVADRCGGCQVMHLSAPAQRAAKARIAGDALRRIAHLDVDDPEVVPSPQQFGYRNKVTFATQQGRLGYHPVGDPTYVFDVHDCLIADPDLRALHAAVRNARHSLPPDGARIVLRLDRDRGRHVIVQTGAGDVWRGGEELRRALERAGASAVVWWHPEGGKARAVAGATDPWPATVFEQVHPAMGSIVRQAALDALGDVRGQQAWDLYAGIGETTVALVARGAAVTSVESDPRAVQLADAIGPAGPRRVAAMVEAVVGTLPKPAAVITNPPRVGMAERATEMARASGATRIAYISCDAATLARDVERLAPTYRLRQLQAFDQFPQTAHLETVALLELR